MLAEAAAALLALAAPPTVLAEAAAAALLALAAHPPVLAGRGHVSVEQRGPGAARPYSNFGRGKHGILRLKIR